MTEMTLPDDLEMMVETFDLDQLLELNALTARLYKARRKDEGRQMMGRLRIGTRVILSGVNKPQYLHNQLATVTELRDTRVAVKLDRGPMGKFRNGVVILNPSLLTVLKSQPTGV